MAMIGENIDIAAICPYAHDGKRCISGSNRQCYFNDYYNKWVVDINFPKGPWGHDAYNACRDDIRNNFASDNRCEAA